MDIYRPTESAAPPAEARAGGSVAPHDGQPAGRPAPSESVHQLSGLIKELKEYSSYLLGAKVDGIKVTVRKIGIYAALGVVGLIVLTAVIAVSTVLLLAGAAGGIGAALGGQVWIGNLIIGMFVLLCIGLGAYLGLSRLQRSMRAKTVNKYEQRQSWQRGQFGRDVEATAASKRH